MSDNNPNPKQELSTLKSTNSHSDSSADNNKSMFKRIKKEANSDMSVDVKPRLLGFLVSYILFSLPGFLTGIIWLIISIIILVGVSTTSSNSGNSSIELPISEAVAGSNNNRILVYELRGPITSSDPGANESIYTEKVKKDFELIKKDNKIKNVVFKMNTPGGEVFASKVLGDLIGDLVSELGQKEAVFYNDEISASGGLLATYQNDDNYVIGNEYGSTGSIGVFATIPNFSGTADKIGYSETVIRTGDLKGSPNIFRDLTPEEFNYFQGEIDREFNTFKKIIEKGRKLETEEVEAIATGAVFTNQEAKLKGLIDEVGTLQDAYTRAANNAELGDNFSVWEYKEEDTFVSQLLGVNSLAEIFSNPVTDNAATDRIEFLKPGRMYYIAENWL